MRNGRPWGLLALGALCLAPPAPVRAQVGISVQLLYTVETVFAADFSPFNVGQQPDFLSILLQNGAPGPQLVVLQIFIRQERPSSVLLFEGKTDPFLLQGAVRRLTNRDLTSERSDAVVTDYEIGTEGGKLQDRIVETGRFPSGTYVFEVRVLRPNGFLLARGEVRLELVNPTRIELLTPGRPFGDSPEVVTGTSPRFQWNSDEGLAAGGTYRIRVVPASAAASAEEAMQGFASWEATTNTTTALYPGAVSAIPLTPGGTYAWQVTRKVQSSGGPLTLDSPVYWFRMAGGGTDQAGSGSRGQSENVATVRQLNELARALGLGNQIDGFQPTGQIIVDGVPASIEGLEALLRAILAGDITVRNITVR